MAQRLRKRKVLSALLLLLCGMILTQCAGYWLQRRLVLLEDITFLYEMALRDGKYRAATKFMKVDKNKEAPDFEHLKNIQISSYELVDKIASSENKKAKVIVEIRYFHIHHLVEKTMIDEQQWEYNDEDKQWVLTSGLPDLR